MKNLEKFNSIEEEKKSADAGPSGSHSVRRENLWRLGSTEEQFVQGLGSSKGSENILDPVGKLMSLD